MKTKALSIRSGWGFCLEIFFLIMLLFETSACVSNSNQKWNSRAGVITVKEAVKELGPPQKAMAFEDGYQVGEWLTSLGTRSSMRMHFGPVFTQRYFDYSVLPRDVPYVPDQYIRLLFGPDGRMITWDRAYD